MGPVGIGHGLKVKEASAASVWDTNKICVVHKGHSDVDKSSRQCDLPKTPKVTASEVDHRSRWGNAVQQRPAYNAINVTEKELSDRSQNLLLPWSTEVAPREKDAGRNATKELFMDGVQVFR